MSISVNHLFNRLVASTIAVPCNTARHAASFTMSQSWRLERKLIHESPFVLDDLACLVTRRGDASTMKAFSELMQSLTLRMQEHPLMKSRPGIVVAFTAHIMHTEGLYLSTLRGALETTERDLAGVIGVKPENLRISPLLISAHAAQNMSPQQIYSTVHRGLSALQSPRPNPLSERNSAANLPAPRLQRPIMQEYIILAHVHTPRGEMNMGQVMKNASACCPLPLRTINLPVQTNEGPAEATVALNLFSAGTPWKILNSSYYTSTMLRVLSACYAVVQGPEFAAAGRPVTGAEVGRALTGVRLQCVFIRTPEIPHLVLRITVMNRQTGAFLGGVSVEGLSEPFAMVSKLATYFENRLSIQWLIQDDPVQAGDEAAIRFHNPATSEWEVANLAIRLEV